MGRLAGVLFLVSGVIVLATIPLPPRDANLIGQIVVGVLALAIGAGAWFAPWDRWPPRASIVLIPPAFALIAFGNYTGGSDHYAYGVFFVVAFVWLGLAHGPWTSVAMAPLAAVAYAAPLSAMPGDVTAGLSSMATTLPVCVMIGEALSWGAARLSRTEEALREEREIAQQWRELDEMKTTFMSAVSHELRTPITICRGHLEVLGDDPSPDEMRATVDVVLDELDRMARLVEDITMLLRRDDRTFLRRESVAVGELMTGVALKVRPFLNGRLTVRSPAPEARLFADQHRLQQALVNLLHNAAVHTPTAAPVELRLVPENRTWRFEVSDGGPGVPAGDETRIFEQFVHGPASKGSGLGLAVVESIATAHGGEAGVRNRPGKGATFWLTIPR
jgi:signal transduction histidine kinase